MKVLIKTYQNITAEIHYNFSTAVHMKKKI